MSEAKVDVVRRVVAAFNAVDAEALGALMTADAELVPLRAAVDGTSYRGPDAAQEFLSDVAESWADRREAIDDAGLGG